MKTLVCLLLALAAIGCRGAFPPPFTHNYWTTNPAPNSPIMNGTGQVTNNVNSDTVLARSIASTGNATFQTSVNGSPVTVNDFTGTNNLAVFLNTVNSRSVIISPNANVSIGAGIYSGDGSGLTNLPVANGATNFYTANAAAFGAGVPIGLSATNIPFTPAVQIKTLAAGTYLIQGHVNLNFAGSTYGTAQNFQLWIQKTNPATIVGTVKSVELPVLTTFTGSMAVPVLSKVQIASANDVYEIYADISANPSAGAVTVDSAEIIAVRLY